MCTTSDGTHNWKHLHNFWCKSCLKTFAQLLMEATCGDAGVCWHMGSDWRRGDNAMFGAPSIPTIATIYVNISYVLTYDLKSFEPPFRFVVGIWGVAIYVWILPVSIFSIGDFPSWDHLDNADHSNWQDGWGMVTFYQTHKSKRTFSRGKFFRKFLPKNFNFILYALWGPIIGRSGRVTHTTMRWLDSEKCKNKITKKSKNNHR